MQKVIVGVVVVWLVVVAGSISLVYSQPAALTGADETSTIRLGRDLSLTLGLDVWPNQWVKTVPNQIQPGAGGLPVSGTAVQQASSFGVAFIPNVTLTYKRFFLSVSYMVTPDYHFGNLGPSIVTIPAAASQGFGDVAVSLQSSLTASRQEADLTIGYFPLDWLGVAIGYKGMFQEFDFENRASVILPSTGPLSSPDFQNIQLSATSFKQNYNGPIAGVLASARIDNSFTLIGNAFGGYLFAGCTPSCSQGNSPYTASKLVLRYAPTPQIAVTLGYRVQIVNNRVDVPIPGSTSSIRQTAVDLTHGAVFGVTYRF